MSVETNPDKDLIHHPPNPLPYLIALEIALKYNLKPKDSWTMVLYRHRLRNGRKISCLGERRILILGNLNHALHTLVSHHIGPCLKHLNPFLNLLRLRLPRQTHHKSIMPVVERKAKVIRCL